MCWKCVGAHNLQEDTYCLSPQSHPAALSQRSPSPNRTNISRVSSCLFCLFSPQILFSLSVTSPSALSSYLRLAAPVRASLTSWCLRVCLPSPLNQRRSTLFLPRGSAPSVHARTAWLTATRSETCNVWEVWKSSLKLKLINNIFSLHYRSPQNWPLHLPPQPGNFKQFKKFSPCVLKGAFRQFYVNASGQQLTDVVYFRLAVICAKHQNVRIDELPFGTELHYNQTRPVRTTTPVFFISISCIYQPGLYVPTCWSSSVISNCYTFCCFLLSGSIHLPTSDSEKLSLMIAQLQSSSKRLVATAGVLFCGLSVYETEVKH